MAAAPSIGRATAVEAPPVAREAQLTHALYERYANQLYGFCYARLGSREEAEDAVQTTFMNAFRGLARGITPQAESAWLFKIAENVCLSRHRSSFRRRRVESPSDLELLQEVVPAREHDGDQLVGLERVLEEMPESQRRAILLREWQGLSYREIAEEMELSQAAVETLIFRARRSLAHGLESAAKAEREPLRRRVSRGADAGGMIATLKALAGSTAAVKTTAALVAVTSATVVAATPQPTRHHVARHRHATPHAPATAPVVQSMPRSRRVAPRSGVRLRAAHAPVLVASRRVFSPTLATPAPAPPAPAAQAPAPQPVQAAANDTAAAPPQPTKAVVAAQVAVLDAGKGKKEKSQEQAPPAQAPPAQPVQAPTVDAPQPPAAHGQGAAGKSEPDKGHGQAKKDLGTPPNAVETPATATTPTPPPADAPAAVAPPATDPAATESDPGNGRGHGAKDK